MPVLPRVAGSLDRLLDVLRIPLVHRRKHVVLLVRHHGFEGLLCADLFAADHETEVELLRAHLLEPHAKLFTLGRAGCVVLDGLVLRRRRTEKAWSSGHRRRL
jgi:hypothetical protein